MRPYKGINRFGSEAVHHTGSNPVLTTKHKLKYPHSGEMG
jgi:hypothetical protein